MISRRDMLIHGGAGFGAMALSHLLGEHPLQAGTGSAESFDPMSPKPPHHAAKAKNIIFLFMEGAPSHLDLFDPKPLINKLAGQPIPAGFKGHLQAMTAAEAGSRIMESPRKWKQHGEAGTWVSDWLPHIAECVDDMAVVRSVWTDAVNHAGGVVQMNTGTELGGRPSLGSWISYGLGTENQDLPAFVVIQDDDQKRVRSGSRNWGAGFMPAVYQGTRFLSGSEPIENLSAPANVGAMQQKAKLDLLTRLNRRHAEPRGHQTELEARIRSYELAFRMQAEAPTAIDLSQETLETHQLYGIDQPETETFGRNCLLARRLVQRGVRFVQLYHGAGSGWDSHDDIEREHPPMCRSSDKPVAGLLKDLKRLGMLDETLVLWGGEFGRTCISETNTGREGRGRDHNPTGFTMWLAGGDVQGGQTLGATDELGLNVTEDPVYVLDLHTTILHLLGMDARQLTFLHQGRPERPDINQGKVFRKIAPLL